MLNYTSEITCVGITIIYQLFNKHIKTVTNLTIADKLLTSYLTTLHEFTKIKYKIIIE